MSHKRWQALMARLSIGPNEEVYRTLRTAYSEPHRHYHTFRHIEHCLSLLDEYLELATLPNDIETALWFHDAIYNPMSKDNEANSAQWASDFMRANGIDSASCQNVHSLIMATLHDAPATNSDAQLLVDIDLSILGADAETYAEFENNVRKEYKWVPGPLFRRGRKEILNSFVNRNTIYSTPDLRERYEKQARINLVSAIDHL